MGPARPDRRLGEPADQHSTAATRRPAPTASSRSTRSRTATTRTPSRNSPGSASVVQGVTEDRYGIGYSGIGYKTSGVKAVPLAETDKGPFSDGSYADVQSGKYPLWRFLYVYVNKAPGKPLDPLVARVRQADLQQGRPGGRGQGRLHAALRRAGPGRAGEDPEVGHVRGAGGRMCRRPSGAPSMAQPDSPFAPGWRPPRADRPSEADRPRGGLRHHPGRPRGRRRRARHPALHRAPRPCPCSVRPASAAAVRCAHRDGRRDRPTGLRAPRRRRVPRATSSRSSPTAACSSDDLTDGTTAHEFPVPGLDAWRVRRVAPRRSLLGDYLAAGTIAMAACALMQVRYTPRYESSGARRARRRPPGPWHGADRPGRPADPAGQLPRGGGTQTRRGNRRRSRSSRCGAETRPEVNTAPR